MLKLRPEECVNESGALAECSLQVLEEGMSITRLLHQLPGRLLHLHRIIMQAAALKYVRGTDKETVHCAVKGRIYSCLHEA